MSDAEQQRIVEDFGRTESPVRVLVASDVASEGLNLHYLSHRLIHFDIPWSLMVFQQRNGRIDRYGQQKRPDIRYMLIESDNKRIKGDMRIIEILITKEEQALKNIGDPSLLLGKFTIEDEELVAQFPQLKKIYNTLYSVGDLEDVITDLSPGDMKATILSLPKGAQDSIKHLASKMVSDGRLDSVRKIKVLDEIFDTEMSIMTGLFN